MDKPVGQTAIAGRVGEARAHDSAHLHVSGRANYTDDLPEPRGLLHAALGTSPVAHADVTAIDLEAVKTSHGVVAVIGRDDIPGLNDYGAVVEDDPIFANVAQYVGQPLFAVVATSANAARRAARKATYRLDEKPAILSIESALEADSTILPTETLTRGACREAIEDSPHQLQGHFELGGQDQFYLEGQIAIAIPREDGDFFIYSSTQHPGEIQHAVAKTLGLQAKDVVVECRRMGGGFGGKESQPALIACVAALAARKTGKPVKFRMDRDTDMIVTGKRHDFLIDYEVGFDRDGRLRGVKFDFASRCGMSADLSGAINDRTMFHADNAYFLPTTKIVSRRMKTHTVSNTAFRGFGGPQGMFGIECVLDDIARELQMDPLDIRQRNFYGTDTRNVTPYGQTVEDNIIAPLVDDLATWSDYRARREAIRQFNADSTVLKRGIALTPVKFGISFTATHLNQAGALVHIYHDGSIHLNHGGTEMGQGLFTKVAQVVAETLQVDIERIKITASDTSKVPNASATAASSGSDINGKAAEVAATTLRDRLLAFAAEQWDVPSHDVHWTRNGVRVRDKFVEFDHLVHAAYMARVGLSATGFYKTPKIHYDRSTFSGRPFYYYAYGAAVTEVVIDTLTGENRMEQVDILHDCGRSLNPAIDLGQIEGGFIQGAGWLTTEELKWTPTGALATHAPATYKIP
ncbi:MAG: xanthine dehydrogenase molybdopterin binding subunit, partial [Pseudomonadota bacterium]